MEGTPFETPVFINEADHAGPTAFIVGGQHGIEEAGWQTTEKFTDCRVGSGTIIALPRACVPAIEQRQYTPDQYGTDLNGHWDPDSNATSQLGREIWQVVEDHDPDVIIDNHSSTEPRARGGVGNAYFPTPEGRAAAKAGAAYVNREYIKPSNYGSDWLWSVGNDQGEQDETTLIDRVGYRRDIPAWIIESARGGTTLEERVRWQTAANVQVLRRHGIDAEPGEESSSSPGQGDRPAPPAGGDDSNDSDTTEKPMQNNQFAEVNVRELGGDPSGEQPIDWLLEKYKDTSNRVRFVFPPGDYRLAEPFEVYDWGDKIEFKGRGQPSLVVEDVWDDTKKPVLNFGYDPSDAREGKRVAIKNLTIDISADGVGQAPVFANAKYDLTVEDVRVHGQRSGGDFPLSSAIFNLTTNAGSGVVDGLDMAWGAEYMGRNDQTHEFIGLNVVDTKHRGQLEIKNSNVEDFPNNGFYVYRHGKGGTVHLRRCFARDNGLTAYRLDRGDTCKRSVVTLDMADKPYDGAVACWPQGGGTFEDVYIKRDSGTNKLLFDSPKAVTETYKNVTIENDGEGDNFEFNSSAGRVIVRNLDVIDTNATGGNDYYTARIREGCSNVLLEDVTYVTNGDKRRGIYVEDADKIQVADSQFDVHRTAIEFDESCGKRIKVGDWCEFARGGVKAPAQN